MQLDHVGIAVADLARAIARWRPSLGNPVSAPEEVASQRVRVVFLAEGPTRVELVEPIDPDSPIRRFLGEREEALHLIAFLVRSVDRARGELAARGERVVDRTGRPGTEGTRVGFAHPSAFGGVLVEFVEGT